LDFYGENVGGHSFGFHKDERPKRQTVVSAKVLNLLAKVLNEKTFTFDVHKWDRADVKMAVVDSHVFFQCGDVTIHTELLDGHFPHWRKYIPDKQFMHGITVHSGLLRQALEKVILPKDAREQQVNFIFNEGVLTLEGHCAKIQDTPKRASYGGVDFSGTARIGFVPKQLITMLATLGNMDLQMYLPDGTEVNPAMFCTLGGYTYVVMPLSVNTPPIQGAEAERQREKGKD
jgi:DNA polymerase III sliding clamp (beta) subunit (PCNA family)